MSDESPSGAQTLQDDPAASPAVPVPAPAPQALMQHVRHENVLVEQLTLMRDGYTTSLQAMRTEYEGNERAFGAAAQRREAEYARAKAALEEEFGRVTAEAEETHVSAQSALAKRIDDLEASITRLQTAIEVDTMKERTT